MRAIKGQNTGPELIVRRQLHSMGYRFRLHRRDLPGSPDIVLPRYNTVIFVHGCFWHRHSCSRGRSEPSTRRSLWRAKFEQNVARDRRTKSALRRAGWRVIVVWECETRNPEKLSTRLRRLISE
ncbi:MAG: DNA mismatch endonuclease Vsr [Phycisphaeraceae bacterium]|nr:MAG: DNA mismatch endonuclease Vsr [Phycisphaeraceae bacterium]